MALDRGERQLKYVQLRLPRQWVSEGQGCVIGGGVYQHESFVHELLAASRWRDGARAGVPPRELVGAELRHEPDVQGCRNVNLKNVPFVMIQVLMKFTASLTNK